MEESPVAYLSPKFENDIFLSYARVDNESAREDEGWVDSFKKLLEIELSKLVGRAALVKIWMDTRQLDSNQYFDDEIKKQIRASGVFLALTSRGYLHPECYCRNELAEFYEKAHQLPESLRVGTRSRIFNALLYNIHHDDWPEEYKGIGASRLFDTTETELGDPSRIRSALFESQVKEVARELYKLLDEYKKTFPPDRDPQPEKPIVEPRVFLADTPESLSVLRTSLINALKKEGIETFPRTPPPYIAADHDDLATQRISKADLAIHLFDASPGEKYIDGDSGKTFLQRQAELGLKHAKSQFIWVPPKALVDIPSLKDEGYREFLLSLENGERDKDSYTFQREPASSVPNEIIKKLKELRCNEPSGVSESALVEMHRKDELHATDLYPLLVAKELQTFMNPDDDDPKSNYETFQSRVRQISVLIIIFGTVASDWVRERLISSLKLAATIEPRRLKLCGIYTPPGQDGIERQLTLGSFPSSVPVVPFSDRNMFSQLIDRLVLGGGK
jgi:hypothetical protein